MADLAIRVENLSKQYRIGKRERYRTLCDTLTNAMYAPFRALGSLLPGRRSAVDGQPSSVVGPPSSVCRRRSSFSCYSLIRGGDRNVPCSIKGRKENQRSHSQGI
jgi:hypothetical protein